MLPKKTIVDYDRMQKLERIHESLKDALVLSEDDVSEKKDALEQEYKVKKSKCETEVAKAKAEIVLADDSSCQERYLLRYKWKERDVAEPGIFIGWFEIKFNGDIIQSGIEFPEGNLKVPIEEELIVIIK